MKRLIPGLSALCLLCLSGGCRDSSDLYGTGDDGTGGTVDGGTDGGGTTDGGSTDGGTTDGGTTDGGSTDGGTTGGTGDLSPGPDEAVIMGMVLDADGQPAPAVNMQFCAYVCINGITASDGSFGAIVPIDEENYIYKVDAIGELIEGAGLGRIRVNATLEDGDILEYTEPLVMPRVSEAVSFPSPEGVQTLILGDVAFTADPADLAPAFGWDDWGYQAGVVEEPADYWEVGAELAVAFVPFDTEISGPISASFDVPEGTDSTSWDVYYVDTKGHGVGPIGTAVLDAGRVLIEDVQPDTLSWLLLVPAE